MRHNIKILLAAMMVMLCVNLPAHAVDTGLPQVELPEMLPVVFANPFGAQEKIIPYGKQLKPATCPEKPSLEKPLSLNEAVSAAICHNPDARIAYLTLLTSAGSYDTSIMSFLPDVAASGSAATSTSKDSGAARTISRSSSAGVSTGMVLYDFGRREATLENAERSLVSAGLSYDSSLQTFIVNSMNSYFSLLRAQNSLEVEREALALAKTTLDAAQARYDLGLTPLIDVLQARASHSQAELTVQTASNDVAIGQASLLRLMGFSPLEKVSVQEIDDTNLLQAPFNSPLAALVEQAKKQRNDLKTAKLDLANAENDLKNTQRRGLPTLSMSAGRDYSHLNISDRDIVRSDSIGVSLKIPIFTGFGAALSERIERKNLEKTREGIVQTERNIEQEVLESWQNYNTSSTSFEIGFESLANATQVKDTTLARYKEGLGTIVDVLNAQNSYRSAVRSQLDTRYNLLSTRLRLVQSVGALSLDNIEPKKEPIFIETDGSLPPPQPLLAEPNKVIFP